MKRTPSKSNELELICRRVESVTNLSRRQVLKSLALLGLLPGITAGCNPQVRKEKEEQIDTATDIDFDDEVIANRPMRRHIANLTPLDDTILAYQDAVRAMKRLPDSDPRNWQKQAEIHSNRCPHSNWLFLPWHRHYLYWFERIVREMSGKDDWALPYWNWTEHRTIPAHFQSPPLSHPRDRQRVPRFSDRRLDRVMEIRNFIYFGSGSLQPDHDSRRFSTKSDFEQIHDRIHVRIGNVEGGMGGFLSPLDPIFWLHHAFIDYIWTAWNIGLGNRNPAEPHWIDFSFSGHFVDADGTSVTGESALVQFCLLLPVVNYRYENSRIGSFTNSLTI
ncbi:MAG: tyrosinase family protein [Pseudomonadota bacterium]